MFQSKKITKLSSTSSRRQKNPLIAQKYKKGALKCRYAAIPPPLQFISQCQKYLLCGVNIKNPLFAKISFKKGSAFHGFTG